MADAELKTSLLMGWQPSQFAWNTGLCPGENRMSWSLCLLALVVQCSFKCLQGVAWSQVWEEPLSVSHDFQNLHLRSFINLHIILMQGYANLYIISVLVYALSQQALLTGLLSVPTAHFPASSLSCFLRESWVCRGRQGDNHLGVKRECPQFWKTKNSCFRFWIWWKRYPESEAVWKVRAGLWGGQLLKRGDFRDGPDCPSTPNPSSSYWLKPMIPSSEFHSCSLNQTKAILLLNVNYLRKD